jgi:hypothetical protein
MAEQSERQKRVAARQEQLINRLPKAPVVRVEPANDDLRRVLKHPRGFRFPPKSGSVEWPLDRFTRRRIADGSVTVASEPKPRQHHHRVET